MNRIGLRIAATVVLSVIALLFTVVMHKIGAGVSGGGMGSRLFLYLVAGPQGVCLLVWPVLAGLLPWTRLPKIALTVLGLALVHPLWTVIVLSLEGVQDDFLRGIWREARAVIFIFGAFFLLPSLVGILAGLRGAIIAIREIRKTEEVKPTGRRK